METTTIDMDMDKLIETIFKNNKYAKLQKLLKLNHIYKYLITNQENDRRDPPNTLVHFTNSLDKLYDAIIYYCDDCGLDDCIIEYTLYDNWINIYFRDKNFDWSKEPVVNVYGVSYIDKINITEFIKRKVKNHARNTADSYHTSSSDDSQISSGINKFDDSSNHD